MKKMIDLETWPRRAHFEFFKTFEEPFFGITAQVECSKAYESAKLLNASFFLYYLHSALWAANATEPFAYRIDEQGRPVVYDRINAAPTINREDGTFGFSYMDYDPDFRTFEATAQKEIARVRQTKGLEVAASGDNVIYFSSLPWIPFTSLSHARKLSIGDSVPKISFGKLSRNAEGSNGQQGDKALMPVSVHVHHALVDGLHVGQFLEKFQEALDREPC